MGIHIIKMPDVGEGIAECEVVAWRVQPGDKVTEDQILADVMTDKATVEIPSPVHGTIVALGGKVGESLAVGAQLVRLEVEGAGNFKGDAAKPAAAAAPAAPAADEPAEVPHGFVPEPQRVAAGAASTAASQATSEGTRGGGGAPALRASAEGGLGVRGGGMSASRAPSGAEREGSGASSRAIFRDPSEKPLAAPAVRKRAWDMGIELQFVPGSGPAGQITHADLDAYVSGRRQGHAGHAGADSRMDGRYRELQGEEAVPLIGLRRKIAEKMQMSKRQIPHFTYVEEVDVTELEALRTQLNDRYGKERGKLTLLPLLMRAVVLAIRKFPEVNARFDDQAGIVTRYQPVHLGIATQTDAGLMVPVIRNAEARDPWSSAREILRLAEAARTGKAARDELSGSTITITSLGPLGGIVTTPVINHPEVAIVGVNRILDRPVVRNGGLVPRKLMNLSSSFDHRVIDGMVAAEFIQTIRGYLETPATLFVE